MTERRHPHTPFLASAYPWLIVTCGMFFYCFNYYLRVTPSVMQNELISAFHISATQFGTLAGLYYWSYTPMQVPAGLIYDKFGVRFVLSLACLAATLGLAIFINAHHIVIAGIGRFLIGLGCAFSYIGTLKLASLWLPPYRFATAAGITTAMGMAAGALSQRYLVKIVENIGYQSALQTSLFAGLALSAIIFLLIRSRPKAEAVTHEVDEMRAPLNLHQLWLALKYVSTNPQMWLIGVIGCLLYLPASVFMDLWGIPYLKSVYQLSANQAVSIMNCTSYGWIIGGPIIGVLSDRFRRRKMPLAVAGFIAGLLLCVVFYVPGLTTNSLYVCFFVIGLCCGAHPLCFALGKESNPIHIAGAAVSITNMLIMSGGAIFQPLVGKLLDLHSTELSNGLHVYSANDYTFALSVIPLGVMLGIFLSLFLKETHGETVILDEVAHPELAMSRAHETGK